jgi:hypothetical protein
MVATMEGKTPKDLIRRELLFFKIAGKVEGYDGAGRYYHCRLLCDLLWRHTKDHESFQWHPTLEESLEEYCRTDEVILTGPATAGKTFGAAMFANLFLLCSPQDTGIRICSTTYRALKERIWSETRMLYLASKKVWDSGCRLVDSDVQIQSYKGSTKHGIFGVALAQGSEAKIIDSLIGFHPKRILIITDELTGIAWPVMEALTNLLSGKQKAQNIGIGNASFIFDTHGRMCEPKEGWNSVTVETERYETKRGGIVLHFDGLKSENVVRGEKIIPFLLTRERVAAIERDHGLNSPQMWRFVRGWWCPEGMTSTVLNDSLIRRFFAMEKAVFVGATTVWAALDLSYEGADRCILRFARTGKLDTGVDGLEFSWIQDSENSPARPDIVVIKVDVSKGDVDFQIVKQVMQHCKERGVDVRNFGLDVTGRGKSLEYLFANEWEPGSFRVEFGGKPSDLPVSEVNRKPRNKEYFDKVTELWYSFKTSLMLGQIRGLDPETAVEFCSRRYTNDGVTWVESKADMKAKPNGKSPDLADAAVIMLDMVTHRGALGRAMSVAGQTIAKQWNEMAEEFEEPEATFDHDPIAAVL